jgi:succinate dehydrogenase / fumarate reductase cytochrome b subunit
LLVLVAWLVALASGAQSYAAFLGVAAGWPLKILLAGLLFGFCYHFANGIRHLLWDAGFGLERGAARLSARLVVALALIVGVLLLVLLFRHGAAS